MVCPHSAEGTAIGACVMAGVSCRHIHVVTMAKASIEGQGQLWMHWQLQGPSYWCLLLWLQGLITGTDTAGEASDRGKDRRVQVHNW